MAGQAHLHLAIDLPADTVLVDAVLVGTVLVDTTLGEIVVVTWSFDPDWVRRARVVTSVPALVEVAAPEFP